MNTHEHHRISDDDDIPVLCKKTFVSISNAVKSLWIVAIVIILPASIAGIGWSIAIGKEQIRQDDKVSALECRINYLEANVDKKLDILIKREAGK